MNDFSLNLVNDKVNSIDLLRSTLTSRFNLKIEKNDISYENLDKQIEQKVALIVDNEILTDMLFLLGLYLCEELKVNKQFTWKLKLKLRLPQYYEPKLFKPGKNYSVGFWPIIERGLRARKVSPIDYMLKRFQR